MNKGIVIGIIVGIAIIIGVVVISGIDNSVNFDDSQTVETIGRNFTIALNEDIGVEMQP